MRRVDKRPLPNPSPAGRGEPDKAPSLAGKGLGVRSPPPPILGGMTGARVGNWYLEAEIGRGPLGIVYRARGYDNPERRAAVKVFTGTGTQDPAFVQKFAA